MEKIIRVSSVVEPDLDLEPEKMSRLWLRAVAV